MIDVGRKRRTYYIDQDISLILDKMAIKTGRDKSVLVCDAIRLTYSGVSQLTDEETKERERIATLIVNFFNSSCIKNHYK